MPTVPLRSSGLPRSGIRAVMDLAWASPEPVVRLEVGQPDASPPDHILAAMTDAIARKETGYTPNAGLPELRNACAEKLGRINGIACQPEQILISAGSMQGLAAAVLAVAEPGDEVLVPDPGWPNYQMICRLTSLNAVAYPLRRENEYRPDFDEIAALITDRTRLVIVNSPSNPLGVVWDADVMAGWLELAEQHDLWLLSDECYDQIVFAGAAASPAALPGGTDRVIAVHSFSKTYAMTGLRVGYVSGPLELMSTMIKMQEALVACVNGPAQRGAIAALEGPQDFVTRMCDTYHRRSDRAVTEAAELGLPHHQPDGAFYLWLPLGHTKRSSMELCQLLVSEAKVAVAPGETFGTEGHGAIRVSLAASEDAIVEGLHRIAAWLDDHGGVSGEDDGPPPVPR
jgi:aspartate aminotransferase